VTSSSCSRNLDTENAGHLSNEKMHDLMQTQLALQRQNVTQRKLIVGLTVFALLLALTNMGTAFVAARLAQDTSLSGPPPETSSASAANNVTPEQQMPESVLLAKNNGHIVGTRTVSGANVNMDIVDVEHTESHGYDDAGITDMPGNKLPTYACVSLATIADMYNSITEGSTAAVRIRNPNADVEAGEMQNVAETYGRVGQSGAHVVFFPTTAISGVPGLTVALDDDRCAGEGVVPTRKRRGLLRKSENGNGRNRSHRMSRRQLAHRSRRVQQLFQGLTHPDGRVRKAAQRFLQALDGDGDVEDMTVVDAPLTEDTTDVDAPLITDEEYLEDALGLDPVDKIGPDSTSSLSDVEFMNLIFGVNFDTPFFYELDINRVPVFVDGTFYMDFIPDGVDLPVFDPNAQQPLIPEDAGEQDGSE